MKGGGGGGTTAAAAAAAGKEETGGGGGGGGGGGLLLVACSDARLILCDRDGRKLCETPRGDSYLSDLKNTRGHTAPLTCCCCLGSGSGSGSGSLTATKPTLAAAATSSDAAVVVAEVASGSEDGTVRLWAVLFSRDTGAFSLKQRVVIRVPASTPGTNRRTKVSALAFLASSSSASPSKKNPNLLVAGTDDGALHAWDPRARKGRPAAAGAVVTGPTARMMGTAARNQDWNFVAGFGSSTSRSVLGAHGGGGGGNDKNSSSSSSSFVSACVTGLAAPPAHLDDGTRVASRGEDGTVRLWDLSEKSRGKKLPLVWSSGGDGGGKYSPLSLPAEEPTTGLAWSPDGRVIATGTSEGEVAFLRVQGEGEKGEGGGGGGGGAGGTLVRTVSVADKIKEEEEGKQRQPAPSSTSSHCSVVPVCWHPKLNQLLVGVFSSSSDASSAAAAAKTKKQRPGEGNGGRVVALFSPKLSERGVLFALAREKKTEKDSDGAVAVAEKGTAEIFNPHALPMYRAERRAGVPLAATGGRKTKEDPSLSSSAAHLPGRGGGGPALGAGSGGRLGVTGGTLLTQHVLKSRGGFGLVAPSEEGDIRERMLAHGDLSSRDPSMAALTSAYRETQPERVFQKGGGGKGGEGGEEEEEEDE